MTSSVTPYVTPEDIRAARRDQPRTRARDLAHSLGIAEAQLVAAMTGAGALRIDPGPDRLMPLVCGLGPVLALTRNDSCVAERVGPYRDYRGGPHASMVLGEEIDLRIFPQHWLHGFAVTEAGENGPKRSIQIFDAAGDAVHKIHLRPESDAAAFDRLAAGLALPDQGQTLGVQPRAAAEPAQANLAKLDILRAEWDRMTDTHQFLRLVKKLRMNRLGAYRLAGAPKARPLPPQAVTTLLHRAAEAQVPVMIFVGNAGCIQIYGGLLDRIVPMGPWINVLDPGHDMHLRADHVAEVWLVNKPTQRGDTISVEAFDAEGRLIVQIFGRRTEAGLDAWNALTEGLAGEIVA